MYDLYFVYGCVLSYLTIRSVFQKLNILIIQKIQTTKKLEICYIYYRVLYIIFTSR